MKNCWNNKKIHVKIGNRKKESNHEENTDMENIWLETDALGLGGVWIGIAPMQDRMDLVHDMLHLPTDVEVFSLFALGYPAEEREQQNRFDETRIHFIEK